jgi:hypothetical protein
MLQHQQPCVALKYSTRFHTSAAVCADSAVKPAAAAAAAPEGCRSWCHVQIGHLGSSCINISIIISCNSTRAAGLEYILAACVTSMVQAYYAVLRAP